MKHFIGYRSDGTFASVETYSYGWPKCNCGPDCAGLANPLCEMPVCKSIRAARADTNPDIVGFYAYDCPCPKEKRVCECVGEFFGKHYLNTKTKQAARKYNITAVFDGNEVLDGGVFSAQPGQAVKFKLRCNDAPNSTAVMVDTTGNSSVDIVDGDEDKFELQFNYGETKEVTLHAPAQGMKGVIAASGKHCFRTIVKLRGWMSA